MKQKLLALLMPFMLCGIQALAHDIEVDGIYYVFTNNGTELSVSYRGNSSSHYSNEYSGTIIIPDSVTYDGKPYSVTSIGDYAFSSCSGLTSVSIPNSVTRINKWAFQGCLNLRTISLPIGLTIIGEYAFATSGLTSINFPNSLSSIEQDAFYNCDHLSVIKWPNSNLKLGNSIFTSCDSLTELEIPANISIVPQMFKLCSGLKTVKLAKSQTTIGFEAFSKCGSLETIDFGEAMEQIHEGAFMYCTKLKKILLPNTMRYIQKNAFSGCSSLEYIEMGEKLELLGVDAFRACLSLQKVRITAKKTNQNDGNVSGAEYGAFYNCTNLKDIIISENVEAIPNNMFYNCPNLQTLVVEDGNKIYDSRNACNALIETVSDRLIIGTASTIVPNDIKIIDFYSFTGRSMNINPTFPYGLKELRGAAFSGCSGIVSIIIPETVASIGSSVFTSMPDLKNAVIPSMDIDGPIFKNCDKLESVDIDCQIIHAGMFSGCTNLKNVNLGNNVKRIERADYSYPFNKCMSLATLTLPASLEWITDEAFVGCENLTNLRIVSKNPPTINNGGLSSFETSKCTLHVPVGTKEVYKAFSGWNKFKEIVDDVAVSPFELNGIKYEITGGNSVKVIGDIYSTFYPRTLQILPTIEYNNENYNVIAIGDNAFENNINILSATLPSSIKSIGSKAFLNCKVKDLNVENADANQYNCAIDAFNDFSAVLHIPLGSNYREVEPWCNFQIDEPTKVYEDEYIRQSSVEPGQTYAIFNTAINGNENRYGFYYAYSSSQLACDPIKPSEFPNTDKYLWEAEDAGSGLIAFKNKSTGTYINAAQRVLGESTGWQLDEWTRSAAVKAPVNSLDENEEVVSNASISTNEKVFTVTNPNGSGRARYWNGNDITGGNVSMPALWDKAHPFAFYSTQPVLYVFNTYILQDVDGNELERTFVKQKAFSEISIPEEWTNNSEYIYTTSGSVGDDGSKIIVTRTLATNLKSVDAKEVSNQIIYDLQGRRVTNPQKGGVYIIGGKKVIK